MADRQLPAMRQRDPPDQPNFARLSTRPAADGKQISRFGIASTFTKPARTVEQIGGYVRHHHGRPSRQVITLATTGHFVG
jgi:hypothetical protein